MIGLVNESKEGTQKFQWKSELQQQQQQQKHIICDLCFYTVKISSLQLVSWLEQFWSVCTKQIFTIRARNLQQNIGIFYSMASKSLFFFFLLSKKISF